MANTAVSGVTPTTVTPDELDILLGSIEVGDSEGADIEEIVEEDEALELATIEDLDVGDAADDEELRALEVDLTKAEVYESAETAVPVAAPVEEAEATAAPIKKARVSGSKKAAAPKIVRDLTALPADAFLIMDTGDKEDDKTYLLANKPSQKKIAEKFDTTIAALAAGRKPSVYVVDCFKVLDAKKSVSSTDLVAALKAKGYTDGTARSQVGQIMTLFPLLGMADRVKGQLELRVDSVFASKVRAVAA